MVNKLLTSIALCYMNISPFFNLICCYLAHFIDDIVHTMLDNRWPSFTLLNQLCFIIKHQIKLWFLYLLQVTIGKKNSAHKQWKMKAWKILEFHINKWIIGQGMNYLVGFVLYFRLKLCRFVFQPPTSNFQPIDLKMQTVQSMQLDKMFSCWKMNSKNHSQQVACYSSKFVRVTFYGCDRFLQSIVSILNIVHIIYANSKCIDYVFDVYSSEYTFGNYQHKNFWAVTHFHQIIIIII